MGYGNPKGGISQEYHTFEGRHNILVLEMG